MHLLPTSHKLTTRDADLVDADMGEELDERWLQKLFRIATVGVSWVRCVGKPHDRHNE